MPAWIHQFLLAFIPLFVAIDPVGLVPVYLSLTGNAEPDQQKVIPKQAILTAFLVGICFLMLGRLILAALGITVSDFQIAGGLILLLIAVHDLVVAHDAPSRVPAKDVGVVPLGLPLIAGPGTLTTLLTVEGAQGFGPTLMSLLANLAVVYLAMRIAKPLSDFVGVTAMRAVSRIVALLLAAIAVNLIRRGWQGVAAGG